jgi:hypothetical protein
MKSTSDAAGEEIAGAHLNALPSSFSFIRHILEDPEDQVFAPPIKHAFTGSA